MIEETRPEIFQTIQNVSRPSQIPGASPFPIYPAHQPFIGGASPPTPREISRRPRRTPRRRSHGPLLTFRTEKNLAEDCNYKDIPRTTQIRESPTACHGYRMQGVWGEAPPVKIPPILCMFEVKTKKIGFVETECPGEWGIWSVSTTG